MRLFSLILIFFLSVNVYSQDNFEQANIIEYKFIELINDYEANSNLIKYEQLRNIMNLLRYVFIENNNLINIIDENNINKMEFSNNNMAIEIIPRFVPMHLTGSYTYCTGKISFDSIYYEFYLYEYNKYSWDYNEIKNNNNLSFCYFDTNEGNYAYFNILKPNEYELFIINKYQNIEYFLEIPASKISTEIIYKKY
jgi:hypothetical protein